MFLTNPGATGMQAERTSGLYLLLMQPDYKDVERLAWTINAPLRAYVAKVRMEEVGSLRVGEIRVGDHVVTVSGAFGAAGLPKVVAPEIYEDDCTVEVPLELKNAWGDGLVSGSGAEIPLFYEWARKTFPKAAGLAPYGAGAETRRMRPLPPAPRTGGPTLDPTR